MRIETVYVYLVECNDGTIYTGITNNLHRRMLQHQGRLAGGARYTRKHGFRRLLAFKAFRNRSAAMKEEKRIKNLSHMQKRELANSWSK